MSEKITQIKQDNSTSATAGFVLGIIGLHFALYSLFALYSNRNLSFDGGIGLFMWGIASIAICTVPSIVSLIVGTDAIKCKKRIIGKLFAIFSLIVCVLSFTGTIIIPLIH